jgi:hypothetical protein
MMSGMSSMKTFRTGLIVAVLAGAQLASAPASALPHSPSQRLELFQTCAGRLSALVEHQWLFDGDAADRTEALRDEFDGVIAAVLPDAVNWGMPGEMAMHWRIMAKAAQAELLSTAAFSLDADRATRARRLADARIAECSGLLIS